MKTTFEDKAVAGVHVDYWFLRDEQGGESTPVLVAKDDSTKAVTAHIVFQKGNLDWVSDRLVEDIDKFGHSANVCIKSDQEPALVDLVRAVKEKRTGETFVEHSKVYDSQSNGTVERAIQSVEGLTRTIKMSLERKINKTIPSMHALMTWMVEHVADLLNKYVVGKDGRTPHERMRGKRYHGEMIEFGRRVFHMSPGKHQGGSMKERWSEGTFVGKRSSSDEYIIILDDGKVVKARSVKLLPDSQSWNAGVLENLTSTPWKEQAVKEETEVIRKTGFVEKTEPKAEGPTVYDGIPRDFYVTAEHVVKFGYTAKCPRCRTLMRGGKSTQSHSKVCRERIRDCMKDDPEDAETLKKVSEKRDEHIARLIEEQDEQPVQ